MTTETTNTALIKVHPFNDVAVIALMNEAQGLQQYAETRIISIDQDVKSATEDLSLIAKLTKAIADRRKEYVIPIKQHLDSVTDAFKGILEPLAEADRITRSKIMAYRQEQERKAREAEEINRLRMEAARKEMELKGELTESVNLVEAPPAPPKMVRTEVGNSGIVHNRKYRISDFAKLPDIYKLENSVLLNKVTRAGVPEIPGVEFYFEDSLRITPK